ncbi:hypothetical protein [Microbacterium sp. NPDC086615]|uniref:DUF6907 domain-containing protein n=1 Tax=Microbacterium sp. NPDC086615 TaxID=3154865 RepID=UPI0034420380
MTVPSDSEKPDNRGGCPSWCIADHGNQTALEDQWHESNVTAVPVVEHWSHFADGIWRLSSDGVTFDVLVEQHVSSQAPWFSFGPSDDRERVLHLSPESIGRLVAAFEVLLRLIKP